MYQLDKEPSYENGFIYILSNPSMPNIFKVGLTTNSIRQRIQELNTTGVPTSFVLVKSYEVAAKNLLGIERLAHEILKTQELHHGKEFFEGSISIVQIAVEDAIFSLTGSTATELVGAAFQRKEAKDRLIQDQNNFNRQVETRLDKENKLVDELRNNHIERERKINKERTTWFDHVATLIFLLLGVGLLFFGPIGWLIAIGVGGLAYYKDHVEPHDLIKKQAVNKYPYKSFDDIAELLRRSDNFSKSTDSSHRGELLSPFPETKKPATSVSKPVRSPLIVEKSDRAIHGRVGRSIEKKTSLEDHFIPITCPSCKNTFKRDSAYGAGWIVRCPSCNQAINISGG